MMRFATLSALCLLLVMVACAPVPGDGAAPEDEFMDALKAHCGKAYRGEVVSTDPRDAEFASQTLTMHLRECSEKELRIPFHVGDDHSRTWVVTRTDDGLRLKHDHRHEDGSEDAVTQYGGDSDDNGAAGYQDFPADDETKTLFIREDIEVSTQNTWRVEIEPGEVFTYQMSRPERTCRVEFDLTTPVDAPPPSWGEVPVE